MVTKEQILRINELSKKQREIGLNEDEKKEQESLRKLYLASVRENFKSQLDNIKIVTPEEYEKLKGEKSSECGCGHDHHHDNHKCSCGHSHHHDDSCGCEEHKH